LAWEMKSRIPDCREDPLIAFLYGVVWKAYQMETGHRGIYICLDVDQVGVNAKSRGASDLREHKILVLKFLK